MSFGFRGIKFATALGKTALLQPDSIFDDKYKIHSVLGEGGMGTVYKASNMEINRAVALKVMHDKQAIDEESIKRFVREAKTLSRLQHRNIVSFQNFGLANGIYYTVMEYLEGQSLSSLLSEVEALPADRALKILLQICQGLSFAHANGIFHRDMKPANVILSNRPEEDTVKIVDFGLAKVTSSSGLLTGRLTTTGMLVGSVHYMSPEQVLGKPIDARTDVYACGCVLYKMITGNRPFDADSAVGVMFKHTDELAPPISSTEHGKDCPQAVERICNKAMEKTPAARYQTMEDMISDLKVAISGHGQLLASVDRSASPGPAASPKLKVTSAKSATNWRKLLLSPAGFLGGAALVALVSFPFFSYSPSASDNYQSSSQKNREAELRGANARLEEAASNRQWKADPSAIQADPTNTLTATSLEEEVRNREEEEKQKKRDEKRKQEEQSERLQKTLEVKRSINDQQQQEVQKNVLLQEQKPELNAATQLNAKAEAEMQLTSWFDAVSTIEKESGNFQGSHNSATRKDENPFSARWTKEQQSIAYNVYLEQKAKKDAVVQAAQSRFNSAELRSSIVRENARVKQYSEQLRNLALTTLPLNSVSKVVVQDCAFVEIFVDPNTNPRINLNCGIQWGGDPSKNVVKGNTLLLSNYRVPLQVFLKDLSALKSHGNGIVSANGLQKNINLELDGKGTILAQGQVESARIISLDSGLLLLQDLLVQSEANVAAKYGRVYLNSPRSLNTVAAADSQIYYRQEPARLSSRGVKKPELLIP